MAIAQIVFFGSAACVVAAFLLMLFVMWRQHTNWEQRLLSEQAERAALEKRFSVIVDAMPKPPASWQQHGLLPIP
jgi:hypothetical protein